MYNALPFIPMETLAAPFLSEDIRRFAASRETELKVLDDEIKPKRKGRKKMTVVQGESCRVARW